MECKTTLKRSVSLGQHVFGHDKRGGANVWEPGECVCNMKLFCLSCSSRLFRKKNPQEGQEKSNSIINILCTVTPRKVRPSTSNMRGCLHSKPQLISTRNHLSVMVTTSLIGLLFPCSAINPHHRLLAGNVSQRSADDREHKMGSSLRSSQRLEEEQHQREELRTHDPQLQSSIPLLPLPGERK